MRTQIIRMKAMKVLIRELGEQCVENGEDIASGNICMWYKLMNMYHPLQHHEYKCFSDILLEIRNCKYQHKKCLVHEYHTKHGDYLKMK